MKSQFQKFYRSEIQNAWMRILAGSTFAIIALLIYQFFPLPLTQGIVWAVLPIACYQIGRGIKKLIRTNKQVKRLNQSTELAQTFVQKEIRYLDYIMPKYKMHPSFEILLLSMGILFVLLGGIGKYGWFMIGSGVGLSLSLIHI